MRNILFKYTPVLVPIFAAAVWTHKNVECPSNINFTDKINKFAEENFPRHVRFTKFALSEEEEQALKTERLKQRP